MPMILSWTSMNPPKSPPGFSGMLATLKSLTENELALRDTPYGQKLCSSYVCLGSS